MNEHVRAAGLASCLLLAASARADLPAGRVEVQGPATAAVGVVDAPSVQGDRYAIRGTIAYEGIEGTGYLELWSVFPDGARYFSRTLAEEGPMRKLVGSASARAFILPFFLAPGAPRPSRLELNVILPGAGRVTLRDLVLASGEAATATPGAWWSAAAGGRIGGWAGASAGLLGAAVGMLASLGRARRFVIGALLALGVGGLLLLAMGMTALVLGQPYEVWYPLVPVGLIGPAVGLGLLRLAHRRFPAPARDDAH